MEKTLTDDAILKGLNEEQRAAVLQVSGPVLILAGAGSGKTRALTHRIAYLISKGVQPWQILSVTFTNKAAKEMKERIKVMLHIADADSPSPFDHSSGDTQSKLPVMGTFHSICVRILRRDIEHLGRDRNFVIYDGDDQEKLMKHVLKDMRIAEEELKARAALSYIGKFKSEAFSPKDALAQASTDRLIKIAKVYELYQTALRQSNALDFDDLILETVRLFHECPEVLDRYQETWRYLHVDEYQDTNHGQYLLITLLAQKYRNICVIGDPDQSIYGFRGADIRNILEFEKEYKDAVRIKLEQNYRSTQPILTAADKVISANPNRPDKNMWTERSEGPRIIVNEVRDERREAEEVVKAVQQMQADGTPLREQVILYRTHAQSRVFEEACMRASVPYRILGGVKFYARKEVKDVLAYLYAILNPYDTVSMLRIINVPSRKIGDTTMQKIQAFASDQHLSLWDSLQYAPQIETLDDGVRNRIQNFTALVQLYKNMSKTVTVSALAEQLLQDLKMETWLTQGDEKAEGEERWRNVQELLTVMHKYDSLDPETSLMSFLEEVALVSEVDKLSEGRTDALTLMTLHLCKGLEFEHVMIVGCEEGLFPHSNSMFDKEQLEEERRIMYVGMTRAKTQLRLFFAKSRYMWGEGKSNAPSRFLNDIPEDVIERRSDEVLSAFSWASGNAEQRMRGGKLEPFRQQDADADIAIEFNQDVDMGSENEPDVGSRVQHPVFGKGTIHTKRGDIVEIVFDGGPKKTFALSIAPIKILS